MCVRRPACCPCQVRVRPVGALANAILANLGAHAWYNWQWTSEGLPPQSWPQDGTFATTCSCDRFNPTGAPEDLSIVQNYGQMMFK